MQKKENDNEKFFGRCIIVFLGLFLGVPGALELFTGSPENSFAGMCLFLLGVILVIFSGKFYDIFTAIFSDLRLKIPPHISLGSLVFILLPCFAIIIILISVFCDLNMSGLVTYMNGHLYSGSLEDITTMILSLVAAMLVCALFCCAGYISIKNLKRQYAQYYQYLEDNDVSLGLFVRPYSSKANIVLANKFVIFEFDISDYISGRGVIKITDKIKNTIYNIRVYVNERYKLFTDLCGKFGYNTQASEIILNLSEYEKEIDRIKQKGEMYLDINACSEAELTAIPGVTIAKAKHARKVRKQQMRFLSLNQFYKEIDLDEEFIEQITAKANKIVLNNLPLYIKENALYLNTDV